MKWGQVYCCAILLSVASLMGCGGGSPNAMPPPPPAGIPALTLTSVVTGLSSPIDLQAPSDNSNRLFVVEQGGTIRIISGGALLPTAFLDISSSVDFDGGEMGLLGLAFHPSYSQNRKFYVNYDRLLGGQLQTIIAEFQASSANPDQADPLTERILLLVNQPFTNHKAGQLAFGPDGFLYIALGDGGSGGDPQGNGQNLQTLLGKMLRIDVDHTSAGLQYSIPSDNPFVGASALPEIWAYGFRNPWRFSFERGGTRLFAADVGQDSFEEIDILQAGGNFGWNTMEGSHCFSPSSGCSMSGLILPITEYDHGQGQAVIGGYVYKGAAIAGLGGTYLFTDFYGGEIWGLQEAPPGMWTRIDLLNSGRNLSSFGQDAAGEIYVTDYSGSVLKLTAQ